MENDYLGIPIKDEPENAVIDIWEITPMMHSTDSDSVIIRSWQDLHKYIEDYSNLWLERYTDEELREGVNLNIKLIKMPKDEYESLKNE